jgi:phosphate starvation-inducible protein PhoH
MQSDLPWKDRALMNVVDRLSSLKGVGIINFKANSIVRHPLIASILEKLEEDKEESGTSSS